MIILSLYIIYLWSVPTHFPRGTSLNNVQSMLDPITKVNINGTLQECDFYNKIKRFLQLHFFHIYLVALCPSDGALNGAPCQG